MTRTLKIVVVVSLTAALAEAAVKAKVAGELVAVTAREGESVKEGQVLAW